MVKTKKNILFGLASFILALLVTAILAELLLALIHPVQYRKPYEKLPEDVWRELLHKPSPIPGLAYELAPNRESYSHGALIRTNSFGMRDDEPHFKPNDDTSLHRIVVIGDSFTLGFGVSAESTYSNVLEKMLNFGDNLEVLNLGVGGYSTYDEALVLEHKGVLWNPDLVVIGYYLNDPEIDPVQPLHAYYSELWWWQHSNLLRLVVKLKNHWDVMTLGEGDYYRYLHAPRQRKWQSVLDAFNKIGTISQKHDIPVLVLIFPVATERPWAGYPYLDLHHQVTAAAKRNSLYVVDLYYNFSRYPPKKLTVSRTDNHPSKLGHQVAASAIYHWILTNRALYSFSMPQAE